MSKPSSVGRGRLETLDEFLDGLETPVAARHDVTVTVRLVSGELLLGPELATWSATVGELRQRLQATSQGLVRLVLGEWELRDCDLLGPRSRDAILEVTAVLTMEPTAEERKMWIGALKRGEALQNLPAVARADAMVVTAAVTVSAEALRHAAKRLRHDKEFVISLAQLSVDLLHCVEAQFRRDPDVVMACLEYSVLALRHADPSLMAERSFMMRAVHIDGQALRFAHHTMRCDVEVILAAVRQDETALEYVLVNGDPRVERERERQRLRLEEITEAARRSYERRSF